MSNESGGDHRFAGRLRGRVERERSTRSRWEESDTDDGVGSENNVSVIGKVSGLTGFKGVDVQGQLNSPLQQCLLDAGLGTQQVAGVSEGNPASVEQLVDVRGE